MRKAEIDSDDIIQAGFTVEELLGAEFTLKDIFRQGSFSRAELAAGSFDPLPAALKAQGVGVWEFKHNGFSATDLTGMFTSAELLDNGFTVAELTAAGLSASSLKADGFASAGDFKEAGFSAGELKDLGFSICDLKAGVNALIYIYI